MQRIVTITLYREFGHPDNVLGKQSILKDFTEELPELLNKIKYPSAAFNWHIDSIKVS